MSTRQVVRAVQRTQIRGFSVSSRREGLLDYFSFTRKNKLKSAEKSTKDVMKELETQDKDLTKQVKIPILGRKNPETQAWRKRMNGFTATSWIPTQTEIRKQISGKTDEEKLELINAKLSEIYTEKYGSGSGELDDLAKRFAFIKQVQIEFGLYIPDIQLTKLGNTEAVSKLVSMELLGKKAFFDERFPNAIYLNPEDYKGTNISITKHVGAKEKEKRFNELVKKARAAEEQALKTV